MHRDWFIGGTKGFNLRSTTPTTGGPPSHNNHWPSSDLPQDASALNNRSPLLFTLNNKDITICITKFLKLLLKIPCCIHVRSIKSIPNVRLSTYLPSPLRLTSFSLSERACILSLHRFATFSSLFSHHFINFALNPFSF